MVNALIEIDEETNKILNLVKAKFGLRDKGQAIEYIVKKFEDKSVEPEFKQINDGDDWMLAENIPDIDFFFSQIWLSCFVNEFDKPAGKAYRKILASYNGYNLKFYFGKKDSFEVGENIVQRFLEEEGFAKKVNLEIVNWADKLKTYSESIPAKGLEKLSNDKLFDIYEKHNRIHTEYYQWAWIPVAADMFHNNLTNRFKEYLKTIISDKNKIEEAFLTLTHPTEKSLIQIEREEFLRLAKDINESDYHRKLFEDLFRRFQEKDAAKYGYQTHTKEYEELLESKTSELIAYIKPELLKKIKRHYEKYFYVNHMWVGKEQSFEFYLKELVKLIDARADINAMLANDEKDFLSGLEKRKKLLRELNIDKKWKELFDSFGDFMITKIYRRFAQIYAIYKMESVLEEIGKRFNISLMQVRFMLPEEVKKGLMKELVDKNELEERTKSCVYYAEKGKGAVYTGIRARQIVDSIKKDEFKEVNEFRGQIACIGKATGKVKIIIRPKDMHKMKKGDILVSIATDPDIVSAMKKAAAIVTEQGGVTSHAAIVSRELRIPCIIGTKIATKVLKDGDLVEVDATKGIVKILKRA